MAKRQRIDQKEFNARWKDLPKSDQRFFSALSLLIQVIGDKKLRYCEPSASRRRSLRRLDRNMLLSVIVECLHLLLDAPMLDRVKQGHRERRVKKKKRISAAKKRQSATKKKSRAKEKPAPKRRKITKGRTK